MNTENTEAPPSGASLRIGVAASRFHQELVEDLLDNALHHLSESGIADENIEVVRVPGSHEIPYAINALTRTAKFDCLIALGVVIAGKTAHHDIIVHSAGYALQRICVKAGIPIINGILLTRSREDAAARCGKEINRGEEFARAAVEMARLHRDLLGRPENLS